MTITYSAIGRRHACVKFLQGANRTESIGIITNVKLTKVGWFTWHLEFKADYTGANK